MIVASLVRQYRADHTIGELDVPGAGRLWMLERPWLDNQCNVSCIPEGVYWARWMDRSASGKYKRCWHVQDVPGRSGILIHTGNVVRHTLGCLLPGKRYGELSGNPAVLSSGAAINTMRSIIGERDFLLVISAK